MVVFDRYAECQFQKPIADAISFYATATDPRLVDLAAEQNHRMAAASGLPAASGPVSVSAVPNLDRCVRKDHPQERDMQRRILAKNPGKYDEVEDAVFLNELLFFPLDQVGQRAVVAHEVAHAMRYQAGLYVGGDLEDVRVDILACRMGFASEIVAERGRRSAQHAAILSGWTDEEATVAAFMSWRYEVHNGFAR